MPDSDNINNLLGMARTAAIAGNNAEAMNYYNRVLEADPRCSEAWIGKGKAAAWASTLANLRIHEATVAFGHAIGSAEPGTKPLVSAEVANEMNMIVTALYSGARNHLLEYVSLQNSWPTYLDQVSQMLDALEEAGRWDPDNRTTFENIAHLCRDNVEGVAYRDQFNQNAPGLLSLSPQYETQLKNRRDQAIARVKAIDPDYSAPVIEKKQAEACFVVTATMGNEDHPTVVLMRRFRDERLRRTSIGAAVIALYYRVGPHLADVIRPSLRLRRLTYILVVRPAAAVATIFVPNEE